MVANLVDLHILTTPFTRADWLYECLHSVKEEPANVHIVRGVWGDLGVSRAIGFAQGNAPYVTFVDHDDKIIPGVLAACVHILEGNPDVAGVFTDQVLIDASGSEIHEGWSSRPDLYEGNELLKLVKHPAAEGYVHHLMVFRREVLQIINFYDKPKIVEPYIIKAICARGELRRLPVFGYEWRIHGSNTFPTFTEAEVKQAILDMSIGV